VVRIQGVNEQIEKTKSPLKILTKKEKNTIKSIYPVYKNAFSNRFCRLITELYIFIYKQIKTFFLSIIFFDLMTIKSLNFLIFN